MPIVNYVREHMRFIEIAKDEKITASERLLWYALMHIMNLNAKGNVWPDDFIRISNDRLLLYCPLGFDAMAKARNGLKQRGLMDFTPGKKNKLSPAYRMNYFFPESAESNTGKTDNIQGNNGGNMRGNMEGNMGGNNRDNVGGNMGDFYINYTSKPILSVNRNPEEEDMNDDNTAEARACEGADRLTGIYPPRNRRLTQDETQVYYWIMDTLSDVESVCEMYGFDGRKIIRRIADSDVYPLDLVAYAIGKTYERNKNYKLDNAAAYTVKLLNDWREQGFTCREDVQEAKGDVYHYG